MSRPEEVWLPLVDDLIGIVERVQQEQPEIARLVESPHRLLAFRTFAYIRVGLVLGQLLVDHDVEPPAGKTWVDVLLENPEHHAAVTAEIRAVAEEIAADPRYADEEPLGPDDAARDRVRAALRGQLESR